MLLGQAKEFAEVIKLRIMKSEVSLDYPSGPNFITRVLTRRRKGGQVQKDGRAKGTIQREDTRLL